MCQEDTSSCGACRPNARERHGACLWAVVATQHGWSFLAGKRLLISRVQGKRFGGSEHVPVIAKTVERKVAAEFPLGPILLPSSALPVSHLKARENVQETVKDIPVQLCLISVRR